METADILTETFNKMPDTFLSKEFYAEARKAGIAEKVLTHGIAFSFLKEVASQPYFGARTWYKKQPNKIKTAAIPFTTIFAPEPIQLTEQEAISFLKERGYKIFKYTEL